ncbi:T9SS type A sorting domain-containing protein [Kaistella palustris]|uniref:T9SS type A sorting domain-containing protein n=1 Tax=Kaistella palustris TaxID=493376 RepID=UPI00041B80DA|nr:T9SS type A sorting domain-containing protein [Kaistella palustris]
MKKLFTVLGVIALSSTAFGQELLVNPGFESGLAPWAAGPTASYTAPMIATTAPHTGANYAAYAGVTATTGFYQTVPITEGKSYTISFWYKSAGDDSDTRLWSLYKTVAGGAPVYTTPDATTDSFRTNNGYLPSAAQWTMYTATMPAGPGSTVLEVAVRAYNNATIAEFDDFSAYEAGTMAVTDVKAFDSQVKMNTIVGNDLQVMLPGRATVNIFSADGKLISSNRINNAEKINTSSLVKGIYIVTVDNGSAKVSRKVVKN